MAAITRQLKAFSRKSKGELVPVNLERAINNALSIVNPKIQSSGVNVHKEAFSEKSEDSESVVKADEVWLGQILVNLFSNAISATRNNTQREIWIDIKEQIIDKQLFWCIQVIDNGTGIDEKTLPHIFEPFFTTKPSAKGLGLGLSISFNLAKDMNGSLKARNSDEGGAIFTLCLPSTTSVSL
jgi:two-component system C4-dicarboxylate transport sensor histidine kinase DctB